MAPFSEILLVFGIIRPYPGRNRANAATTAGVFALTFSASLGVPLDAMNAHSKELRFPAGRAVTLQELDRDPYAVFARLAEHEPISWIPALGMWYVVGYENVRTALADPRLTTVSERSTIYDTFGEHMLTSEGAAHDRYRRTAQQFFTPSYIRSQLEPVIRARTESLVDDFEGQGRAELRSAFAARLPVQAMLSVCGLPAAAEPRMRAWYDDFEAALANFSGDRGVRDTARRSVSAFHALMDEAIRSSRGAGDSSLVAHLVHAPPADRLDDEAVKRNLSIIFFGGISTVEGLLLNSLWALFETPGALDRVRRDIAQVPQVIEETMRWLSPVQSATRHVTESFEWQGIEFAPHDTVNCMLGAANRDPAIFVDPDRFDLDRANSRRHLGFAVGAHSCLGSQLAKAEARIGLQTLLTRLPGLRIERDASDPPSGYEFRQPRRLTASWDHEETRP
jgi:cytochrome P450